MTRRFEVARWVRFLSAFTVAFVSFSVWAATPNPPTNVGIDGQNTSDCPNLPGWASCVNKKIAVDAGGSYGLIDFEDATYKPSFRQGEPVTSRPRSGCTPKDWVFYDSTVDGYKGNSPPYCRSYGACGYTDDLVHIWSEENNRHVLFKNITVKNAFRSSADQHIDLLQTYFATDFGGWIVIQDSTFKNSDDENLQLGAMSGNGLWWDHQTSCPGATTGMGGLVLQNVSVSQDTAFVADCQARKGSGFCGGVNGINADQYGSDAIDVWLINVTNTAGVFTVYEIRGAFVIVGTPPAINWDARWAAAKGNRYYYDTIDQALSATLSSCQSQPTAKRPDGCRSTDFPHARPPFLSLSTSGWAP